MGDGITNQPVGRRRAESDGVIGGCTGEGAATIIVGVAVSTGAGAFEVLRICTGLTRVWSSVRPAAAVLRIPKRLTRAFA